jgi:hypothetical protein
MPERFNFNPEESAFRAELIGNLKIDPKSPESKRLLEQWAIKGEKADSLQWCQESVDVYKEAEVFEYAIYALKCGLIDAVQQGNEFMANSFRKQIEELGGDPDNFDDVYNV